MHPLADTPFYRAFPILCCCLRPFSGQRKPKDAEQIRKEIKEISKRLDTVIEKAGGDPYKGTSFKRDMCNKFQIPKKEGSEKIKEKVQSVADKESPFVEYGFGIKAWINTLLFLFLLFIILSVFAYGIMM